MSHIISNKIPKHLPGRLIKISITFFLVGVLLLFLSYATNVKMLISLGTITANTGIALFGVAILTRVILYFFKAKKKKSKNDSQIDN